MDIFCERQKQKKGNHILKMKTEKKGNLSCQIIYAQKYTKHFCTSKF